jgi:hypothetical protein
MLPTFFFFFLLSLFCIPAYAHAILPPDIIFTIGYQFAQISSLIVLVIGGFVSGFVLFFRTHSMFFQKYTALLVSTIIFVVIATIGALYLKQELENNKTYLAQIELLDQKLQEATRITTTTSTSTIAYATSTTNEEDWGSVHDARKLFFSDTLYLFGDDAGAPFYLEIDMNRRQVPNGTFMHYYYTVGVDGDLEMSDYQSTYSTSTVPLPNNILQEIVKIPFSDKSTREEYRGKVIFKDFPLSFTISNLQGDFITHNSILYTRYQSVGTGIVTFQNKTMPVHVLVENIHASDFSKQVFFDGFGTVSVKTRQFTLWDDEGNFYLIDQSDVASQILEYPSHTWLLYKNASSGYTKKGFSSEITGSSLFGRPETSWSITAPDFNNAIIKISLTKYIDDGDFQTRLRALVTGTVTDNAGTRNIHGFGFIIK